MHLAAVPDRLVALADLDLVGRLRAAAAVASELPGEHRAGVTEAERSGFAVGREPAHVERRGTRNGGDQGSGKRSAPEDT